MLDRLKQKETTKRVLFLHSRTFQYSKNMVVSNGKTPACEEQHVYLRVRRSRRRRGSRGSRGRDLHHLRHAESVHLCVSAGRP